MKTKYEEIFELLGIKNVTSKRQRKNGTHVFEIPFETRSGENIRLATYKSGAVRNLNSCYSCYQLNPTKLEKWQNTSFDHKVRIPITSHEGRLEFLFDGKVYRTGMTPAKVKQQEDDRGKLLQ